MQMPNKERESSESVKKVKWYSLPYMHAVRLVNTTHKNCKQLSCLIYEGFHA